VRRWWIQKVIDKRRSMIWAWSEKKAPDRAVSLRRWNGWGIEGLSTLEIPSSERDERPPKDP